MLDLLELLWIQQLPVKYNLGVLSNKKKVFIANFVHFIFEISLKIETFILININYIIIKVHTV
jgi:hypothetical protein